MAAPALSEAPAENELPSPHAPTTDADLFEDDPGPSTDPQDDDADNDSHDHDDADIDAHDAHDDNDNDVSEETREFALERDRADGDDPAQDLADGAVAGPRVSGFVVLARKPRRYGRATKPGLSTRLGTTSAYYPFTSLWRGSSSSKSTPTQTFLTTWRTSLSVPPVSMSTTQPLQRFMHPATHLA